MTKFVAVSKEHACSKSVAPADRLSIRCKGAGDASRACGNRSCRFLDADRLRGAGRTLRSDGHDVPGARAQSVRWAGRQMAGRIHSGVGEELSFPAA